MTQTSPTPAPDAPTLITHITEWTLNEGSEWTLWISVAIGVAVALRFLRAAISGVIQSSTQPEDSIRNVLSRIISSTKTVFFVVLALAVTAPFLSPLTEDRGSILSTALAVTTVIQIVIWLRVLLLGAMNNALSRAGGDPRNAASLRSLGQLFINIALAAVGTIMVLNNIGVDASGLIAGLGVGGIAIGLAAQSLFEDLFAGMSIMLDRPFVRGDFVSFKGFNGTVEKIGLKTTRLRALSGEQLSVTNSNLLSNEIQNYKLMRERRVKFQVGVTYQTPHDQLAGLADHIKTIVSSREACRFDRCHLSAYGDSAILFECVYYVLSPDYAVYMDEQQRIYLDVHKLFEEMGLDFAYPTQTIFVEKSA